MVLDPALVQGFILPQQMVMLVYRSSSVRHWAEGPPTMCDHFILGQMPTAVPCHTDEEARVLVSIWAEIPTKAKIKLIARVG